MTISTGAAMRRLLFLLLLSLPLVSQVKILMPVVVKDAAGKPVTDLKISDFQVSGPKDIRLSDMWLVPPQTPRDNGASPPVVVIYDAANILSNSFDLNVRDMRDFLHEVAQRRFAVTVLINTEAGLRLVYDSRTPPEILLAALARTAQPKTMPSDIKAETTDATAEEQARNLTFLNTTGLVHRSRLNAGVDQMNSLLAFAHLAQRLPGRKALVWVATNPPVLDTRNPAYWNQTTTFVDKHLLPMYEATVEELNAARVSVYPLLFSRTNPIQFGNDWGSWMGLTQLAESTGGLASRLGDQGSLLAAVHAALADLGPYYMLAVEVPIPKELDWIGVKIKATRPGVTVRAASGFLSLKPVKAANAQAAQH